MKAHVASSAAFTTHITAEVHAILVQDVKLYEDPIKIAVKGGATVTGASTLSPAGAQAIQYKELGMLRADGMFDFISTEIVGNQNSDHLNGQCINTYGPYTHTSQGFHVWQTSLHYV